MSKLIVKNGSYNNQNCIQNLINYILTDKDESKVIMYGGFGVNSLNKQTIIDSMVFSKQRVNKEYGRQAYHIIISIYNPISKMDLNQKITYGKHIVYDLGEFFYTNNIQSVCALQTDKQLGCENIHVHCVINSLNMSNGLKIKNTKVLFSQLLNYLKNLYPYLKFDDYVIYD